MYRLPTTGTAAAGGVLAFTGHPAAIWSAAGLALVVGGLILLRAFRIKPDR